MRNLLALLGKDIRRDAKQPWSIVLLAVLPVIMTGVIALVFGGHGGSLDVPTIRVAVLDQDRDLVGEGLRFLSTRGEAAEKLEIAYVSDRAEGIRLLERRSASALVVLPHGLTESLLDGRPNTIEIYENPAEQYLPNVVRHGVSLLALGLSGIAGGREGVSPEIRQASRADDPLARAALALSAFELIDRLQHSLIELETIAPSDYRLRGSGPSGENPAP